MSVIEVKKQVDKFLEMPYPEVYAITGKWGVGKTFAWQKWFGEAQRWEGKKIGLSKYTYVSLFGINSLEALKTALFQNVVSTRTVDTEVSIDTLRANIAILSDALTTDRRKWHEKPRWAQWKNRLNKSGRSVTVAAASIHPKLKIPFIELSSDFFSMTRYLSITEAIICIDDLERIGKGLSIQDVLGLISSLVEQRKCKVLLILNEDAIESLSNKDEYEKYKMIMEKVIDVRLNFNPLPAENVDLFFSSTFDTISDILKTNLIRLNTNNIRIIRKIDRMARTLYPLLVDYDPKVAEHCLSVLILFTCCYYDKSKKYPPLEFLLDEKRFYRSTTTDKGIPSEELDWIKFAYNYGYQGILKLDFVIAEMVKQGFVNEEHLQIEAEEYNRVVNSANAETLLSEAWSKFTDTFEDNTEEIIQLFTACINDWAQYISVYNLNLIVRLMRELGSDEVAEKLINTYCEKRGLENLAHSLRYDSWKEEVSDPTLKERLKQIKSNYVDGRTLLEVVDKLSFQNGWGTEDVIVLANASIDDYYNLFHNTESNALTYYIRDCIRIGRMSINSTATMDDLSMERYRTILANVIGALRRIGKENSLNGRRIKRFDIDLDE